MKNSKIVAAMAAAALTVSMMAVPVSALKSECDDIVIDTENNQAVFDIIGAGYDINTVESVTFKFTVDDEESFGGGIMSSSTVDNGWKQDNDNWAWGNEGAGKAINAEGADGVYTLTFDVDDYYTSFDGDIEYAKLVVQQWWGNEITFTGVDVAVASSEDVTPTDAETTDAETTDGETTDSETTAEDDYTTGDMDGDGVININDIVKLAAFIKGKRMLPAAALKAADINGDGNINVTDLVKLAAHVKGKRLIPGVVAKK
ncbi:dockerin type I repeat-containing protein [Ruminococcus albus]|uniref:Dockerin domain-containing protein n=1 Tax=Ruminococcus albus TaxID=1264 RepID=A0A1I1FZY2_RUMAL|nr:dockerin type I repeat-containing protein [Ruminococcus albus]SFC05149.1 hypothetical protein SAMN02910406_01077 [Ruminococcus albus]